MVLWGGEHCFFNNARRPKALCFPKVALRLTRELFQRVDQLNNSGLMMGNTQSTQQHRRGIWKLNKRPLDKYMGR